MATAGGTIRVELIGDKELKRKLVGERADKPVSRFLDRAAFTIQGAARKKAPVDTGRLRNSIGTESPSTRSRTVGPSVKYGEWVETGTSPHYPPLGALQGWAKRHGMSAAALQQSIGTRGTKAQPFMRPAADESEDAIANLVPILAAEIESAYQ